MQKMSVILVVLLFFSSSFAEISADKLKAFKSICSKMYKGEKKTKRICACEELNFKWLVPKEDWESFKKIYSSKEGESKLEIPDELEALDTLVYEVTTSCNKKTKYIAPKTRSLMSGAIK